MQKRASENTQAYSNEVDTIYELSFDDTITDKENKNIVVDFLFGRERQKSPLFCSGIDVGGVEVCTSAKINVINRIFIHIFVIPLMTLSVDCCWQTAE